MLHEPNLFFMTTTRHSTNLLNVNMNNYFCTQSNSIPHEPYLLVSYFRGAHKLNMVIKWKTIL